MENQNFEILLSIFYSNSRIVRKLEQTLGAVHGLGLNEFLTLYHLNTTPAAQSRIALAEFLGLSASGVTRLLSPMEKRGLVEKQTNERDARLSLVKSTNAGAVEYQQATLSVAQVLTQLFARVSESEKNDLLSITDKIR